MPPDFRHEAYRLTEKGETLVPVAGALRDWGLAHIPGTEARLEAEEAEVNHWNWEGGTMAASIRGPSMSAAASSNPIPPFPPSPTCCATSATSRRTAFSGGPPPEPRRRRTKQACRAGPARGTPRRRTRGEGDGLPRIADGRDDPRLPREFPVRPRNLGVVAGADSIMRLRDGRNRLPDVSFTAWVSLPAKDAHRQAVADFGPDLAVEVLSVGNTEAEIDRKRREYCRRARGSSGSWTSTHAPWPPTPKRGDV